MDELRYACREGFEQRDPDEHGLVCSEYGSWYPTRPDPCVRVSCGPPPAPVPHGSVISEDNLFGSRALYRCDEGYYMTGDDELECGPDRLWSPSGPPRCDPVSCGSPEVVTNGRYSIDGGEVENAHTFGRSVVLRCNPGYELPSGEQLRRTCTATGEWSPDELACSPVSCGAPDDVKHATYTAEGGFTYGERVVYSCAAGYELEGAADLQCGADAEWNAPAPTCEPIDCERAPTVANSEHSPQAPLLYPESVTYTCREGYRMVGTPTLTCTVDGSYDVPAPSCPPVSCGPPTLDDHVRIVESTGANTYGDEVKYACAIGHEMTTGVAKVVCRSSGEWSSSSPQCQPVSCGIPASISNGARTYDSELYLALAIYTCDEGELFVVSGEV